jgi:hypothetical protein
LNIGKTRKRKNISKILGTKVFNLYAAREKRPFKDKAKVSGMAHT